MVKFQFIHECTILYVTEFFLSIDLVVTHTQIDMLWYHLDSHVIECNHPKLIGKFK